MFNFLPFQSKAGPQVGHSEGCGGGARVDPSNPNCNGQPQRGANGEGIPDEILLGGEILILGLSFLLPADGPALDTAAAARVSSRFAAMTTATGVAGVNLLDLALEGQGGGCGITAALTGIPASNIPGGGVGVAVGGNVLC
jgi:hypothetical protein